MTWMAKLNTCKNHYTTRTFCHGLWMAGICASIRWYARFEYLYGNFLLIQAPASNAISIGEQNSVYMTARFMIWMLKVYWTKKKTHIFLRFNFLYSITMQHWKIAPFTGGTSFPVLSFSKLLTTSEQPDMDYVTFMKLAQNGSFSHVGFS